MIPKINPEEYTYELPEERIARYPLPVRDKAKLLVYEKGKIRTAVFRQLADFLRDNDTLVINNTRVIRARLLFHKETGARIEIFCLEPVIPAGYELVFGSRHPVTWECMIGNARKWKEGSLTMHIASGGSSFRLRAEKRGFRGDASLVTFSWDDPSLTFGQILDLAGVVPIPPYLNRESTDTDIKEYQTVYARQSGSVAAPTAGLHFTPEMMETIRQRHRVLELTLHVGAGTFKPIQARSIQDHTMHTEHYAVTRSFLEDLLPASGRIIAVGTTSVRTLESLYWLAERLRHQKDPEHIPLFTDQWEPYTSGTDMPAEEAINILLEYMNRNHLSRLYGSTRLMIVPGYRFRLIRGMVTNFHLPKSTLLLLIAAFTGNRWKDIYQYALEGDFRFLSYGDASLLLP